MGWYDVIEDMTQKQLAKTELGDNRINGVTIGIVAKKYSKDMPGRVCVQIPVRDDEANVLKWARIAFPSAGKKWGTFFLPEIGDQVLLVFEEGNIDRPYIIGCVHGDNNRFIDGMADEDNQFKSITTRNGNKILFEDNKEGEGDKDKIKIETAKSSCKILLDNENQKLVLSDKSQKNMFEMNMESGNIKVKAENKMTIEVGSIKVTLDGESGKISINCGKFNVKASDGMKLETDGMNKIKGSNVVVEGNSSLKMSSGNVVVVEGSLIKMG